MAERTGSRPVVLLIASNKDGAARGLRALKDAGCSARGGRLTPELLRELKEELPNAIVIDLGSSPAQGRDVGVLLRRQRRTRKIPLVFVGGAEEKVRRVKELLPDAFFVQWRGIGGAVRKAVNSAGGDMVVPESAFAAYKGTPLVRKLGIREGFTVALVDAPEEFERKMVGLPPDVSVKHGARARCDMAIWFVRSEAKLRQRIDRLGALPGRGGLWIAWPKRSSGVRTDLTQQVVRRTGLESGLVDYKICAVDDVWSGLRFTRRSSSR